MKKIFFIILCFALLFAVTAPAFAAPPANLTWDGKAATLTDIANNTGYDMVDAKGNYKPLYADFAVELWENGLFLGSDGSFDLDRSLTRTEAIIMTVRMLGKEAEAKATTADITFTDVADWSKPYIAYATQSGITKGYSASTFGSEDPTTAAQYITFALRAMGYKDDVDFVWDKSYDKALEIGLIGQPCHTQYSRSNLFLRDNVAVITYNAIFYAPTKGGGKLENSIVMPGKPSGEMPTFVREDTTPTPEPPGPDPKPEPGNLAFYDTFPSVPTYDSVDTTAENSYFDGGDNYAYYYYKPAAMDADAYKAALVSQGFYRAGTINLSFPSVTLEYYSKGDIHVAFGKVRTEFNVRIVQYALSSTYPTANELRAMWSLFNR